MEYLILVITWFLASCAIGIKAESYGRNTFVWFFLSGLFSPLLAGLFLWALPDGGPECPRCKEHIKAGAAACRHCQVTFTQAQA